MHRPFPPSQRCENRGDDHPPVAFCTAVAYPCVCVCRRPDDEQFGILTVKDSYIFPLSNSLVWGGGRCRPPKACLSMMWWSVSCGMPWRPCGKSIRFFLPLPPHPEQELPRKQQRSRTPASALARNMQPFGRVLHRKVPTTASLTGAPIPERRSHPVRPQAPNSKVSKATFLPSCLAPSLLLTLFWLIGAPRARLQHAMFRIFWNIPAYLLITPAGAIDAASGAEKWTTISYKSLTVHHLPPFAAP
jgi:hypothetical protein